MLVLTRRKNEKIMIGDDIVVTISEIRGSQVIVGIDAPKECIILREELCANKQRSEFSDDAGNR